MIRKYNMKWIEDEVDMSEVMIAPLDAIALYPLLNIRDVQEK